MFMRAITKEELNKEIMKLNSHKATGPDNISAYILKRNNTKLLQPLLHIINMTIEDGTYPEQAKMAKVESRAYIWSLSVHPRIFITMLR